ncbi:MAG: 16S rRNA (adenine(1518)-N(6)/adenine(1519)-N(6))-dimethyltransferase RsmA [Candidatus Zambryskibacteria bacterium]|nr:16S rRNA (adenine(1518)-N(6)/adenine(1519)-N(6))-dimethyltransferase RsmA [Candidatus Zambryskibacteria bacterium]
MYAKKSLGQHFLKSEKALNTIIDAGEIIPGETVLEIGPGTGALTEKLLATSCQLLAVEKDDGLHEVLKNKFEKEIASGKLTLIHDDILNFDESKLKAKSYKLVANIPYNITGAILEKFLSAEHQPERVVLLVQKEVAERIVGNRGSKASTKESILSISVKAYGTPKYVETVKAGSFAPAPNVDSAILAIDNISKNFFSSFSEIDFFKLVKSGFQSKRKKLSSNLSNIMKKEKVLNVFKKLELSENIRAENVSISLWKELTEHLLS